MISFFQVIISILTLWYIFGSMILIKKVAGNNNLKPKFHEYIIGGPAWWFYWLYIPMS